MANIEPRKNANGIITSYRIKVLRGTDENGKRIFSTRSYPDKKRGESIPTGWSQKKIEKEVERIAVLFEEECKAGKVPIKKMTFSQYAKQYMNESYINGNMNENSLRTGVDTLKKINDVKLDGFGYMELAYINVNHINKFYASLFDPDKNANTKTGGALSVSSIRRTHSFISSVFSSACRKVLLPFNPCQYATIPKQEEKPAESIKKENLSLLIAIMEAQKTETKLACYILMTTGVRIGELLGIQFKDCDFDKNQINIHNNIQYIRDYKTNKYKLINKQTLKNGSLEKIVSVSSYTMDLVKQYAKERKIINLNSELFIFSNDGGITPMHPSTIRHNIYKLEDFATIKEPVDIAYFDHQTQKDEKLHYSTGDVVRLAKKAKLADEKHKRIIIDVTDNNYADIETKYLQFLPEHIYPHKFRHTCASMLFFEQLDVVAISKQLGHRNVATTMRIYAHAFVKEDNRPASIFDKIIQEAK